MREGIGELEDCNIPLSRAKEIIEDLIKTYGPDAMLTLGSSQGYGYAAVEVPSDEQG